jgi:hypothetical protein
VTRPPRPRPGQPRIVVPPAHPVAPTPPPATLADVLDDIDAAARAFGDEPAVRAWLLDRRRPLPPARA